MSDLSLSVVIITHNRASELENCLRHLQTQTLPNYETVIVDNASTDNTRAMLAAQFPKARVITTKTNLGVPAGRNVGYRAAKGDICVTIDDDALLYPDDALARALRYFDEDPFLACVSFDVRNEHNQPVKHFIPRRDRKPLTEDRMGAFFVGTGHAVHRARFIHAGGFWEELGLYFGEEPDLSYRMLEAGYHIVHSAHISVRHHESKTARPKGRRIYSGTRNVPLIALKNLPWHCVASLTCFAWGYYFIQSLMHGCPGSFLRGVRDCFREMRPTLRQRKCISKRTIALLKKYSGVYWY